MLSALGFLLYSNTLQGEFQFDDKLNIVSNPLIHAIENLWPPSSARWFGLLTFALNYRIGGLNPTGYHLVNTAIHICTALTVYLFVQLTCRTPYFDKQSGTVISDRWLAFACAALFIVHPIQTQAVTYIVQRFTSLAALLFMLSLSFYSGARQLQIHRKGAGVPGNTGMSQTVLFLYAGAGIAALLSLKTKENAYTLPFVLVMYEVMFLRNQSCVVDFARRKWRMCAAIPVLALVALIFVSRTYNLTGLLEKLTATNDITRHDYLVTQFRVIVTYIRLLFFPINQTVDHHYKVYDTVLEPSVFASLLALTLLAGGALYLLKVTRTAHFSLRLVSFGILWFFITLSVESTLIPISDVMFEHRLYLPGIGLIIAVTAAFVTAVEKTALTRRQMRQSAAAVLVVTVLVLATATYARNAVWKNELTLWSDAIAKHPDNPRGYNMVGSYYRANFRIYEAIDYFRKALEVDNSYAGARSNLGNAYIQTGRTDEGIRELLIVAAANRFDAIDSGLLHYNIAKGYYQKGKTGLAIEHLHSALRFSPKEPWVYFLLGEAYLKEHRIEQGAACFKKAHELNPGKF